MQQQFSGSQRILIKTIPLFIRADMCIPEPHFSPAEPDKAVPVFIPAAEKRVFCSNLSASPLFRRKDVLLRGTHRRHALLLLFQPCLLPDL